MTNREEVMEESRRFHSAAAKLVPDVRPHIGGRRIALDRGATYLTRNPATGKVVAEYPACGAAEIDLAVKAARAAFEDGRWAGLAPAERSRRLRAFADRVEADAETLALCDTLEMGMPISQSLADVSFCANGVRTTAETADKLTDEVIPSHASALVLNVHEPHGVVGAITPWNFPMVIALGKIASAIAVGNSVVLKSTEVATSSSLRLADLAVEAGIPEGVVNVIPGTGQEAGAALALHPDVDHLTFTGSTATGKLLMELAGRSNLKRLSLECGGKSPQIVLPDVVDLDGVATQIAQGFLYNTGQVCTAGTRLIVHRSLEMALLDRVLAIAGKIFGGDPLDPAVTFGPLASATQYRRVAAYLAVGRAEGAIVALGSEVPESPDAGCYVPPTVFTNVQPQMRISQEEIFGPVLSVMAFDTLDEAVALANSTVYGLISTVWTRDTKAGLELARRLSCGHVSVAGAPGGDAQNTMGTFEPHGQSGFGAEGGVRGLRSMMKAKSIVLDLRR